MPAPRFESTSRSSQTRILKEISTWRMERSSRSSRKSCSPISAGISATAAMKRCSARCSGTTTRSGRHGSGSEKTARTAWARRTPQTPLALPQLALQVIRSRAFPATLLPIRIWTRKSGRAFRKILRCISGLGTRKRLRKRRRFSMPGLKAPGPPWNRPSDRRRRGGSCLQRWFLCPAWLQISLPETGMCTAPERF